MKKINYENDHCEFCSYYYDQSYDKEDESWTVWCQCCEGYGETIEDAGDACYSKACDKIFEEKHKYGPNDGYEASWDFDENGKGVRR